MSLKWPNPGQPYGNRCPGRPSWPSHSDRCIAVYIQPYGSSYLHDHGDEFSRVPYPDVNDLSPQVLAMACCLTTPNHYLNKPVLADHQWYLVPFFSGKFHRKCSISSLDMSLLADTTKYNRTHTLQWRHNGHDDVSDHQPYDCLLNRLFRRRWKKASKLRVSGLCEGDSLVTGEYPAQRASNLENVSIWWRHHEEIHMFVLHLFCFSYLIEAEWRIFVSVI